MTNRVRIDSCHFVLMGDELDELDEAAQSCRYHVSTFPPGRGWLYLR